MADLDQQFLELARSTAKQLKQRGKETRTWKSDSGQVVEGWSIAYNDVPHNVVRNGSTIWDETWGHGDTILSVDGNLYSYEFHGYETNRPGKKPQQLEHRIRSLSASSFVGREGAPFSKWTARLQRLPYE